MPAKTWIKDHMTSQDGSAMIAAQTTHFLGPAQVERIVQFMWAKCDKATYCSQAIYSFEHFSTDLQEAFTLLANYDNEVPQGEQILLQHEKILMNKADFNAAIITTLMDGNHAAFADAVACISQYVSHFFPAGSNSPWCIWANMSSTSVAQIAQEKKGEKYFYNGVDITDFTRQHSRKEWIKIKDLWSQVQAAKDCKSMGKDPKGKASARPADKCARAMQKKINSLTKKVASLQEAEGSSLTNSDTGGSAMMDHNDEGADEATGPWPYGKKHKASS